jgi:hypothetical protein
VVALSLFLARPATAVALDPQWEQHLQGRLVMPVADREEAKVRDHGAWALYVWESEEKVCDKGPVLGVWKALQGVGAS